MILFIRHGETLWGSQRINQGALDSPLTEKGRLQVDTTKRILSKLTDLSDPELTVYVSPSQRSLETYDILFGNQPNHRIVESRIRAVSAGSWDGQPIPKLNKMNVNTDVLGWQFNSPDGEAYEASKTRAIEFLAEARQPSIVISHGLIGRVILGEYLCYDYKKSLSIRIRQDAVYKLESGKITELLFDSKEKELDYLC